MHRKVDYKDLLSSKYLYPDSVVVTKISHIYFAYPPFSLLKYLKTSVRSRVLLLHISTCICKYKDIFFHSNNAVITPHKINYYNPIPSL